MRKKTAKKKRKVSVSTLLLLSTLLLVIGWELVAQQGRLKEARAQEEQIRQSVEAEKQAIEELRSAIEQADDPEMLESLARSELDMAYPDEKVFIDSNNNR